VDEAVEPIPVFQGAGADDDAGGTDVEEAADVVGGADAAAAWTFMPAAPMTRAMRAVCESRP